MSIAYVLPTRNRPEHLARTLGALGALAPHSGEVIIVDCASDSSARAPTRLPNGLHVRVIHRSRNNPAEARNTGAAASDPASRWLVMLDDDSYPLDAGHLPALDLAGPDVLAVGAEIFLPRVRAGAAAAGRDALVHADLPLVHEAGGLPEVFVGCGVAIRRDAYLDARGYDPAFEYYAEEYDLSAKLLLAGGRITFERRFRVLHHKTAAGRDMNAILRRLVRNNGWVARRYAPASLVGRETRAPITRYARIARKERALAGYAQGLADLLSSLRDQPRREMSPDLFARFTGLAAARSALQVEHARAPFTTAALVDRGKNDRVVEQALRELGVTIAKRDANADALVVGTLSPGPILDAAAIDRAGRRVLLPWVPESVPDHRLRASA